MHLYREPLVFSYPNDGVQTALKLTANKYRTSESASETTGLTLLFAHCIGTHKEQWEPVLERIFSEQQSEPPSRQIREAWCFDWQNHGDAAVLNKEALKGRPYGVSVYEWAAAIASVLETPHLRGHRVVAFGHSAGGAAVTLATRHLPAHPSPYVALFLIESTMVTREVYLAEIDDRKAQMDFAVTTTRTRRKSWNSTDEAFKYLSKRFPWSMWDPRVVKIYAEHGLYPTDDGVSLKCDPTQESVSYPSTAPHHEAADYLATICSTIPVHLIWGENQDLIPDFIQKSLGDAKAGRTVASVSYVEDAGHMVVQEKPDGLALAICKALNAPGALGNQTSKL